MTSSPKGTTPARPVFDPYDPLWASDPFPLYADLRQRAPVHRNDLGFWVVARHADCLAVLRDRRATTQNPRSLRWIGARSRRSA